MIINSNLRQAIRSAINVLQDQNSTSTRQRSEEKAISALLASPKLKAKIRAAENDLKKGKQLTERGGAFFSSLGIYHGSKWVKDYKKFVAAGGKIPPSVKVPRFDFVMAEVAAADEKHAKSILKQIGIIWE